MDKELLFKPRLPEAEVEIPGVGTVRVRSLTREEVLIMRKATDNLDSIDGSRALAIERKMIAAAMVDPELTEAEVGRWQKASPAGELAPITLKIQELSGMLDGADKEAYKSLPGEPGAGVRVLPGDEATQDGGRASGAYL